jgi:PAS domain S-box-containing protein
MPDVGNQTTVSEDSLKKMDEAEYWKQKYHSLENELNEINFRKGLMFQNIKQGYWYWNRKTDETYYSPEYFTILGYEVNEFEPSFKQWMSLIHPDDRTKIIETQEKFLNNEIAEYDSEFRVRKKNGEYIWILNRGYRLEKDE